MDNTPSHITIHLPGDLHVRTGGQTTVAVSGRTVREVIDALDITYPGLRFNLCHETGELRAHVNIFVGGKHIRYLHGLDSAIPPGATLYILPSVAGG